MEKISAATFRRQVLTGDALPESLAVRGDLYLGGCTALTTLPAGLAVEGSLGLSGCPAGESLSVGMDSRGYRFYRVPMADGIHVVAGCRNFTAHEAREHWAQGTECRALAEKCLTAVCAGDAP